MINKNGIFVAFFIPGKQGCNLRKALGKFVDDSVVIEIFIRNIVWNGDYDLDFTLPWQHLRHPITIITLTLLK